MKRRKSGRRSPPYEIFPHTADVGLRVRGKAMPDLFKSAAEGMNSLLTDPKKFRPIKEQVISLRSDTWESLLVEWLQEILYFFTVKRMAFSRFSITKIEAHSLNAVCRGEKIDLARHPVYREIKAVTYHNLRIRKSASGYMTEIIFDI